MSEFRLSVIDIRHRHIHVALIIEQEHMDSLWTLRGPPYLDSYKIVFRVVKALCRAESTF